jgi:hypothetical protein
MAVVKSFLKLTESESVVKVAGTAGAATISLATDLLRSTEALTVGGTPTVTIRTLTWSGAAAGVITITRNGVTVFTLLSSACGQLDLGGQFTVADNTEATSDIVVTISGGQAEVMIRVAKVAGYSSKIETAEFSVYDNTSVVGS